MFIVMFVYFLAWKITLCLPYHFFNLMCDGQNLLNYAGLGSSNGNECQCQTPSNQFILCKMHDIYIMNAPGLLVLAIKLNNAFTMLSTTTGTLGGIVFSIVIIIRGCEAPSYCDLSLTSLEETAMYSINQLFTSTYIDTYTKLEANVHAAFPPFLNKEFVIISIVSFPAPI
ncbi:hypothetical protein L208DRAFT_1376990 [Tricholoma matsutake]|nr:hypothetical protein L208DRAFT_1376990 [Tricholoma matsutake 945]